VASGGGAGGAPPKAKKSRIRRFIGGLVAVAAVVGVILMTRTGSADKGAPPESIVAPAPAPPRADSIGTAAAAESSAPEAVTTQPPVRLSTELPGTPPEAAKGTPATGAAASDIEARLPKLLDLSSNERTAQEALDEAKRLEPRATRTSERVGLGLVKAQALGFLRRDNNDESCKVLRSIEARSKTTSYAKRIEYLLNASCRP
jgi:hypothetical protein